MKQLFFDDIEDCYKTPSNKLRVKGQSKVKGSL